MLHDDVYNALQDCDLVLSSTYTTSDSPEHLTAKYHFRRARLRLKLTMYEEALEDYEAFNQLRATGGISLVRVTDAEKAEVFNAISQALREPLADEVKLFRAVQVSAIFVYELHLFISNASDARHSGSRDVPCKLSTQPFRQNIWTDHVR